MNKIYTIENIDCANCAAKIEKLISNIPEIEDATITFATKQLRVTAENPDKLIPEITRLANTIENGVIIKERDRRSRSSSSKLKKLTDNNDSCGCGEEHINRKEKFVDKCQDACCQGTNQHDHDHNHNHDNSHQCDHDHNHNHDNSHQCDHDHQHDHDDHQCNHNHQHGHDHNHVNEAGKGHIKNIENGEENHEPAGKGIKYLWDWPGIALGTIIFIAGLLLEKFEFDSIWIISAFVVSYIILGGKIVFTAVRNIAKGQIFDENFLMSIATLGAFAINQYPEAVGVMLFFRIGEFFEEKAVEKSRNQIMDAVDLRPEVVSVITTDAVKVIPAEDAEIGDILLVRAGDRIPLDGIVWEGETRLDTSPITGEPIPRKVSVNDKVVSGCINTSGVIKIKVEKTLENSMVTRILDSVENAAANKPKIDKFITRFARIYTPFVVALALATAIIPSLITGNWEQWIYTALTFLVISCPCALVLSVPLAFFSGIGAGSKQGILFKGGVALEALKSIKAVVMDKTGTITKGEFTVQNIICSGNLISLMTSGQLDRPKGISNKEVEEYLLVLAASCEAKSTHPIAISVVNEANKYGLKLLETKFIEEIAGKGIRATLNQGVVLCGNRKLMDDEGVDLTGYKNTAYGSEVLIAVNNKFVGALIISDTIKPDSKSAIEMMKKKGIVTAMLTGDGEESAMAVAKTTGVEKVFARLLPDDKLSALQSIRQQNGRVMFVGDGINDAPVLAGADVGAAMGSGADAAIEAADVVFMNSNLESVPRAINIAKITGKIAIQNVVFALTVKILVMILGLAGIASMWMAVFADSGVAMICVLNSVRILYRK
ncbi:MAG: heavy metal translocating P-type ATPase [Aminipila sp.]